jgi:hypothetical protein
MAAFTPGLPAFLKTKMLMQPKALLERSLFLLSAIAFSPGKPAENESRPA